MLKGIGFETSNVDAVRRKGLQERLKMKEQSVQKRFLKSVLVVSCHVGQWRVMKCGALVIFVIF